MTLNHLNLTVADPTETSAFLAKYFGLQPRGGNLGIQLLNDDRGMVLTLIKARPEDRVERGARPSGFAGGALRAEGARPDGLAEGAADTSAAGEVKYPSSFHIGFIQPSHERVNEINRRLRDDGFAVDPPAHLHGSWTFYFTAPGGFTIEVLS
jgi:catechol 2,3-dioxygenase-like lactoylglutathione lyase family enzyme